MAIFLTFPVLIFQIYRFMSPGLKKSERGFIRYLFIVSPLLFYMGFVTVYYLILPAMFQFFLSFEQFSTQVMQIRLEARISEYISLCFTIMTAYGLAFQLQVLLTMLAKMGVLKSGDLKRYRRFAIVIIFIIAAILTPPDILSQVFLAGIMIILYELSILACKKIEKS